MKRAHFIGLDTHRQFCEVAVIGGRGELVARDRCETTMVALSALIEAVPRPRSLVIEEGPLAGWLWRGLHQAVDRMVVSEPRGNRGLTALRSLGRSGRPGTYRGLSFRAAVRFKHAGPGLQCR